jgi:hypothetical protein
MAPKPPTRGDVIKVSWQDILEDPIGNPDAAKPCERISYGLFWARETRGAGECLITTTTLDMDNPSQQGYCVYPMGCILKIEVVKRAK